MIFHPQHLLRTDGKFVFEGNIDALAHPCLHKELIKEFWQNFTYQGSSLRMSACEELVFSIGNARPLALDGFDYSINIEEKGIALLAKDEKSLLCAYMTLLDRFKAIDGSEGLAIELECCQIKDKPLIRNRMVHFCVFPETELWELQRFVRFCGALKYTHIVLEFWGMLRYDCMKELAWSHAYQKEEIKPIIREANALGMEVIPMFNHWGHASGGRVMHGKHVVLDQNPALQTYFSEDGWCWAIEKPKVRALLRQIREELIELCGDGSYFHIGCDEAYGFDFSKEHMDWLCDYLNEISEEMRMKGRRAIMWGDMLLYHHAHYNTQNNYTCLSASCEAEQYMLEHLHQNLVIADWQYGAGHAPVETSATFTKAGFDCLLCPWDRGKEQTKAVLSTVKEQALTGVLHTTWHTLSNGMFFVTLVAMGCFESIDKCDWMMPLRTGTAALLRKVMPIGGDYQKAGWSKFQVDSLW